MAVSSVSLTLRSIQSLSAFVTAAHEAAAGYGPPEETAIASGARLRYKNGLAKNNFRAHFYFEEVRLLGYNPISE